MKDVRHLNDGKMYATCTELETPGPTMVDGGVCKVEVYMVEEPDTGPRKPVPLSDISATALHVLLNPCPGDSSLTLPTTLIDLQNIALDSVCIEVNDSAGECKPMNRKDMAKAGLLHTNTATCCALPTALRIHVMSKNDMAQILSACLYLASRQLVIGLPDVASDVEAELPKDHKRVYVQLGRRSGRNLYTQSMEALKAAQREALTQRGEASNLNRKARRALAKGKGPKLRGKK